MEFLRSEAIAWRPPRVSRTGSCSGSASFPCQQSAFLPRPAIPTKSRARPIGMRD